MTLLRASVAFEAAADAASIPEEFEDAAGEAAYAAYGAYDAEDERQTQLDRLLEIWAEQDS